MTRKMSDAAGSYSRDCAGSGGGSGGGNSTSIDTIHNDLSTPCFGNIFNTMLGSGLTSELTTIFQTVFNTNDFVDYNVGEVPNLTSNASALTTGSFKSNGYITIQTNLNKAQLANASKEYIAETIFHEIIHGYLSVKTNIKNELQQHTEMINTYVDCELAALQEIFPNLTNHDGLCLILGGMGDIQQYDSATLNTVLAHYNLSLNDVNQTNQDFKSGSAGMSCNPGQPVN